MTHRSVTQPQDRAPPHLGIVLVSQRRNPIVLDNALPVSLHLCAIRFKPDGRDLHDVIGLGAAAGWQRGLEEGGRNVADGLRPKHT